MAAVSICENWFIWFANISIKISRQWYHRDRPGTKYLLVMFVRQRTKWISCKLRILNGSSSPFVIELESNITNGMTKIITFSKKHNALSVAQHRTFLYLLNGFFYLSQNWCTSRWVWGYGRRCCPYLHHYLRNIQKLGNWKPLIHRPIMLKWNELFCWKQWFKIEKCLLFLFFSVYFFGTKFEKSFTCKFYFRLQRKRNYGIRSLLPENNKYNIPQIFSYLITPHWILCDPKHNSLYDEWYFVLWSLKISSSCWALTFVEILNPKHLIENEETGFEPAELSWGFEFDWRTSGDRS